jgi:hypothetical protein
VGEGLDHGRREIARIARNAKGDFAPFVAFRTFRGSELGRWLDKRLSAEPEQSDVVHDLLAHLAELYGLTEEEIAVVGNPPYVRPHRLDSLYKSVLWSLFGKTYQAKSDILNCFIQLGLDLLKHNGRLGKITSDSWRLLGSALGCSTTTIITQYRKTRPVTLSEAKGLVCQGRAYY